MHPTANFAVLGLAERSSVCLPQIGRSRSSNGALYQPSTLRITPPAPMDSRPYVMGRDESHRNRNGSKRGKRELAKLAL
jgi:hypothetical protein